MRVKGWILGVVAVGGLACAVSDGRHDESGEDRGPLGKADLIGSCETPDGDDHCGSKSDGNCWCDELCVDFGDCCEDKAPVCDGATVDPTDTEFEVLLTDPHCDECSFDDKDHLRAKSPIITRVVELIDGATVSVDAAQFTFSVKEIEQALLRATDRGVDVRLAINAAQDNPGTVARRLLDAGVDVRFIRGKEGSSHDGLQHSKFMVVDGETVATGSNNWSSTGTTFNEENTIVIKGSSTDPLVSAYACHFGAIWDSRLGDSISCSTDDAKFTPGSAAKNLIRDEIRAADETIDVLMHHFTFRDLVKELAKAAERGVHVRVIVNEADRDEHTGGDWNRLFNAGGEIRYKQSNEDAFQLMHHKLAIIDGETLLNGSGNWSGSGFFNNYENFVRYQQPEVVQPFEEMFGRLWQWSLTGASLDDGTDAAQQHAELTDVYFGNLHAHVAASERGRILDDGKPERRDAQGEPVPVEVGPLMEAAGRFAFEYARDEGGLDFLAITPHCTDDVDDGNANLDAQGYEDLRLAADEFTTESAGTFVAFGGVEWSTNSTGNHVNVLGSSEAVKVQRGRFDVLYDDFLPSRVEAGDHPIVMLNHPRTMRQNLETLLGSWDQVYGVNLGEISRNGERTKKFNDYGLDDYAPLSGVRDGWIEGNTLPDAGVVDETLATLWEASRDYVRLMEVTLGRGNEIGHEDGQNPSLGETEEGTIERRTKVHTDWDYYLLGGFEVAPAASHDNHFANWGTGHTSRTAIVTDTLAPDALMGAIEERLVYASEDEDLEVRLYAGGRVPMGSKMRTLRGTVDATLLLQDPDYEGPITVTVFRGRLGDDTTEALETVDAQEGWTTLELSMPNSGDYFFYVAVHELEADRMAWSAPIWVQRL